MFIYKLMDDKAIKEMEKERPVGWVCKKMRDKNFL